jgi:hypothetical protein
MRAHRGLGAVTLAFIATTAASHTGSALQIRAGTGTPATVTEGNDYPFLAKPLAITVDGVLEATGAGKLTFEYLGYEAVGINTFLVEGEDCFTTGGSKVGATCSATTAGGIVNFQCRRTPGGEPSVAAWSNRAPTGNKGLFTSGRASRPAQPRRTTGSLYAGLTTRGGRRLTVGPLAATLVGTL